MRRAQVSVFIVIGIFLLVGVGLAVYLTADKEPTLEQPGQILKEKTAFELYIEECLHEVAVDGINTIGTQGGYYEPPLTSLSTIYSDIPYYYYKDDVSLVLSPPEIVQEYSDYIEDNVAYCVANYQGQVLIEKIEADVKIRENELYVELDMPSRVVIDDAVSELNGFSTTVDVRLLDVFNIVNYIVTNTLADPYYIDYTMLFDMEEKYGMEIDLLTYMDDIIVYVIQDPDSVNDVEFMFLFAVMVEASNHAPVMELPESMTARVGQVFYYDVDAADREDEILHYSTDSEIFGINAITGEITFTPKSEDVGVHAVTFKVSDGTDTTEEVVNFVVQ